MSSRVSSAATALLLTCALCLYFEAPTRRGLASETPPSAAENPAKPLPENPAKPPPKKPAEPPLPLQAKVAHHNFGLLYDGEQLEFTYEVKNTSQKTVWVREVRPDCVCTTVDLPHLTREIAPGAVGKIPIKFNTSKLKPGRMKETIEVFYDDDKEKPLLLELEGRVERLLFFRPEAPNAEAICGGDEAPKPKNILVTPIEAESFAFLSVRPLKELVHARFTNDPSGGNRAFLRLVPRTDIDCQPQVLDETLIAEVVVDDQLFTLHIPVDVVLRPRIRITPLSTAFFSAKLTQALKDGKGPVEKTFDLRSLNKPAAPFKVIAVKTQTDGISARATEVTPGLHWQVTVRVETVPPAEIRRVRDVVEIKTDDLFAPLLRLPVTVRF